MVADWKIDSQAGCSRRHSLWTTRQSLWNDKTGEEDVKPLQVR